MDFFLSKALLGRLLGRLQAHFFLPKISFFNARVMYLHFWIPTDFSIIKMLSPYPKLTQHVVFLVFWHDKENKFWMTPPKIGFKAQKPNFWPMLEKSVGVQKIEVYVCSHKKIRLFCKKKDLKPAQEPPVQSFQHKTSLFTSF